MSKRRTPIRHTVKSHTRKGKTVREHQRGSGVRAGRSRRGR